MPLQLKRDQAELPITDWDWKYLLSMAKKYGWKPLVPPAARGIEQVPKQDAISLADAVEKALPEIPEDRTISEDDGISGVFADPLDWFSGDRKMIVRDFIAFCRGGGFVVEPAGRP